MSSSAYIRTDSDGRSVPLKDWAGRAHQLLVLKMEDGISFLKTVERATEESDAIARAAPALRNFEFRFAEEFKERCHFDTTRMVAAAYRAFIPPPRASAWGAPELADARD
jgi:hypothetical protein